MAISQMHELLSPSGQLQAAQEQAATFRLRIIDLLQNVDPTLHAHLLEAFTRSELAAAWFVEWSPILGKSPLDTVLAGGRADVIGELIRISHGFPS